MRPLGKITSLAIVAGLAIFFGWRLLERLPANSTTYATTPESISTLILPHHDLVKPQREQFLAQVAPKVSPPTTIILISPNHYQVGRGKIQTSDQTWQLSDRSIDPNLAVIDQLNTQV